jgi:FkbM family methyltransferase
MRWITGSGNHGCWLGSYEYEKQKAFSELVRRGDTVYDLGANVGFYTLLASVLAGPEGRVVSFEPLPRNLAYLRRHLDLNGITNCSVWETAVSNAEGAARFEPGETCYMGHLGTGSPDALTVRTIALDPLVASGRLPAPDVIKCDIEGAEHEALLGASQTLAQYGPTLFLATHGDDIHERCCTLLSDLGYQVKLLEEHPLRQRREVLGVSGR